jgi:hypothetical protein
VESPTNHRLTEKDVTIHVATPQPLQEPVINSSDPTVLDRQTLPGYWIRQEGKYDDESMGPMYTRYQPLGCPRDNWTTVFNSTCSEAMSLERFKPYKFIWNSRLLGLIETSTESNEKTQQMLRKRVAQYQGNDDVICLFGASHSRFLLGHLQPLTSIPVHHVYTQYSWQLGNPSINNKDPEAIASMVRMHVSHNATPALDGSTCTIIIVGMGAWDAGSSVPPTTIPAYEQNTYHTVLNIQTTYPTARIFLWNIHILVLGTHVWASCPAIDHRHAAFIDEYNGALQRIEMSFLRYSSIDNSSDSTLVSLLDLCGILHETFLIMKVLWVLQKHCMWRQSFLAYYHNIECISSSPKSMGSL